MNSLIAIAFCVLAVASAQTNTTRNCTGATGPQFDAWCNANCNNVPANCPASLCVCADEAATAPLNCTAVGTFAQLPTSDEWCSANCNFEPAFCPSAFCSCVDPNATPLVTVPVSPNFQTCCDNESRYLFFSDAGRIFRKEINAADPELCYELPGGNAYGMIVDNDGNLYVADPVAGTLYRLNADVCNSTVEIVTSWATDGIIDTPTAVAISPDGTLLVSGSSTLWEITLLADGSVNEITLINLPDGNFRVRDIEVIDGTIYIISRDARVLTIVPGVGQSVFIDFHAYNVVDYGGITANECGFFFTDSDSNLVYFCPGLDASACEVYCSRDETLGFPTCENTREPTAIASGCCCDIFISNSGNGCVTTIRNSVNSTNGNTTFVPEIVMCNLTQPNAVTYYVPANQNPTTCAQECNPAPPSISITPSSSPSPSVTAAPSVSASSSVSAAPSQSPSSTATPSSSPSPSSLARITGRLVPGINMQFAGGVTVAQAVTGTATLQLIKCEPGVVLEGLTDQQKDVVCPATLQNSFKVPVNKLVIANIEGEAERMTNFQPFLTAVSSSINTPVCLLHAEVLINRGGVISICDDTCIASQEGRVVSIDCIGDNNPTSDAKNRVRNGATNLLRQFSGNAAVTVTSTQIPDGNIQSASSSLCDGEVSAEFSINIMAMPQGTSSSLNVLSQPRFDFADRCDGDAVPTARVCYKTSGDAVDAALTGVFGDDDDLVCISEFLRDGTETDFFEFDDRLRSLAGDIIDPAFGVSGRTTGCPPAMNNPTYGALCYGQASTVQVPSITHRVCLLDTCGLLGL